MAVGKRSGDMYYSDFNHWEHMMRTAAKIYGNEDRLYLVDNKLLTLDETIDDMKRKHEQLRLENIQNNIKT